MIQAATIRGSSLGFKLERVAQELLKGWLDCACATHSFPKDRHQDTSHAIADLMEVLSSALNTLVETKTEDKTRIPGWSHGYVCGFAQGNLDVLWTHRYLVEPSTAYADLMKMKAVLEIISLDRKFAYKIAIIYRYLLEDSRSIANIEDIHLPDNVLAFTKARTSRQERRTKQHAREIEHYFEVTLLAQHTQLLRKYHTDGCTDLCQHFTEEEFASLIGKEYFAEHCQ